MRCAISSGVASSLDSMILGEPTEVLWQLKGAFEAETEAGTTGPVLNRSFRSGDPGRQEGADGDRSPRSPSP